MGTIAADRYSVADRMKGELTRLARLVGTDAGFYVLALHSFLEHYVRDVARFDGGDDMPALLTVVRSINHPRYPTVPMRLVAEDAPVTLWDNTILELETDTIGLNGSATQVRKIFSPERDKGEILGDGVNEPDGAARLLVSKLIEKDLLFI